MVFNITKKTVLGCQAKNLKFFFKFWRLNPYLTLLGYVFIFQLMSTQFEKTGV